jgi:hypothetical protein
MTQEEMQIMQPSQEYIRELQRKRNAGTENCMLSSELAKGDRRSEERSWRERV